MNVLLKEKDLLKVHIQAPQNGRDVKQAVLVM
jgi:hypothetical protein